MWRSRQQQADPEPVLAGVAHHPLGEGRDRHRRVQQMDVIRRIDHHVFHGG